MARLSFASVPMWAWAALLLAAACMQGAAAGGSYHQGCQGYPSHPDCDWYWSDGNSCKGTCKYGGIAMGSCNGGSWNVTQPCPGAPTGCKLEDLKFMYVSKWSCKDSSTCYAYCDQGYKGVVKAICSGNSWHYYGECVKVEPPKCEKYCYSRPPSSDGVYWPNNCYGADYVKAYCMAPHYQSGYVEAKCECGKWVVSGQCKKVEQPRCDKYCYSMPPLLAGIAWPNSCYGSNYHKASCGAGYYPGSVEASCQCGKWVVKGSCQKVQQPTCEKYCYGLPAPVEGVYFPNNCWGTNYFKAQCMSGYEGYVEAKCECGKWVTYGNCKHIVPSPVQAPRPSPVKQCPQTCSGKPGHVDGIYWPNSCKNTGYVKAHCKPGYESDYVEAKCECGNWVTYGSCKKIVPSPVAATPSPVKATPSPVKPECTCTCNGVTTTQKCHGTPNPMKYGKAWKKCSGKSNCHTACSWGYHGKGYSAMCMNGEWAVTGSCSRKKYLLF